MVKGFRVTGHLDPGPWTSSNPPRLWSNLGLTSGTFCSSHTKRLGNMLFTLEYSGSLEKRHQIISHFRKSIPFASYFLFGCPQLSCSVEQLLRREALQKVCQLVIIGVKLSLEALL